MCCLGFLAKVGVFENREVSFCGELTDSLLGFCRCSEQGWQGSALACAEGGECGFSVWNPEQFSCLPLPWKTGIFMTQYWSRRAKWLFPFLGEAARVSNSDVFIPFCLPLRCCTLSIAVSVSWGLFAMQSPSLRVSQALLLVWEGNVTMVHIMGTMSSHLPWAVRPVYSSVDSEQLQGCGFSSALQFFICLAGNT